MPPQGEPAGSVQLPELSEPRDGTTAEVTALAATGCCSCPGAASSWRTTWDKGPACGAPEAPVLAPAAATDAWPAPGPAARSTPVLLVLGLGGGLAARTAWPGGILWRGTMEADVAGGRLVRAVRRGGCLLARTFCLAGGGFTSLASGGFTRGLLVTNVVGGRLVRAARRGGGLLARAFCLAGGGVQPCFFCLAGGGERLGGRQPGRTTGAGLGPCAGGVLRAGGGLAPGASSAGPPSCMPVPLPLGLIMALPPMLSGWPGPPGSRGCPLKVNPVPVYMSGVAPAVETRSQSTTWEPGWQPAPGGSTCQSPLTGRTYSCLGRWGQAVCC